MNGGLNLGKELVDKDPKPFPPIHGGLIFSVETPAHQFTKVVAPVLDGGYCLQVVSRDSFDEGLATAVMKFVSERIGADVLQRAVSLLDGFGFPGYEFDTVAVLSPGAANAYKHENKWLNERCFVAFAMYRCELSGDESAELIDQIRHESLDSLDWRRLPGPKVWLAYENKKSRGRLLRSSLAKMSTVLLYVKDLYKAKDSWVKLKNYAGREWLITWNEDGFNIDASGQELMQVDKSSLVELVKTFLCEPGQAILKEDMPLSAKKPAAKRGSVKTRPKRRASPVGNLGGWPVPGCPGFVAFECDYITGSHSRPEDEEYYDLDHIERSMRRVLTGPGNYFGIIDQFGVTLQFMANDDGTIHIDFPDLEHEGSRVKDGTLDECVSLVRSSSPSLASLEIPGLTFEAWEAQKKGRGHSKGKKKR